jgi:ABC-type transport system involved in multi-copper enzyme maturation permease subunit
MNPVLAREVRQRFRRGRSATLFTVWLLVIASLAYLIYLAGRAAAQQFGGFGVGALASNGALGRTMFELITSVLLTAVLFIVPGVMALSIVGERDRLTLKLIQVSQLRPWQIVIGKLLSGLAYVLILLVAAAPILVLPLLIGGVRFSDALTAFGMVVLVAVVIGSTSLWVSTRAKSARGAVAGAYLWSFFLAVGTLILLVGEVLLLSPAPDDTWGPNGRELYSTWLNPYIATVSIIDEPIDEQGGLIFSTPFRAVDELLIRRQGQRSQFAFEETVAQSFRGDAIGFATEPEGEIHRGPIWVRSVISYLVVIALTLWLAARTLTVPAPSPLLGFLRRRPARGSPDAAA